MIRKRAELDTVNPPGQIVNPITGQRTLNDYYRDKKYLEAEQPAAPDGDVPLPAPDRMLWRFVDTPVGSWRQDPHWGAASVKAYARAILAAAIPPGYVVVPVEPTISMLEFGSISSGYDLSQNRCKKVWTSMLAARPGGEG